MGQKTHPRGFRLGIIDTWDSQWYAPSKSYAQTLVEDKKIREFVKKKLSNAGISKIEVWRKTQSIQINIHAARPGIVVGKGGAGLDTLRAEVGALVNKKDVILQINVLEVTKVDLDAQLTSEVVAQQLIRRVAFKKAMKQAIQRSMRAGAKGIKVMVSGRLGGTDIARTEWVREGAVPLHTLRADIHYGFSTALTVYGIIGVKVWIYRGDVAPGEMVQRNIRTVSKEDAEEGTGERRKRRGRRERDTK